LILLALPREATELSDVNDLAKGLGKNSFIDLQRFSESPPKPSADNRPLTVTRGRELLGLLDQHAQAFEAFDTDRRRPGRFATQTAAVDTIEHARNNARRYALPLCGDETGTRVAKSAVGDEQ
jgi:hypothetical protein